MAEHNRMQQHDNMEKDTVDDLADELQRVLLHRSIRSVYQPIVSLHTGTIAGYEALTRGPEHSPLVSPLKLFKLAEEQGVLYPFEKLARETAIRGAFMLEDNELLFINISAAILQDPGFTSGRTLEVLESVGMLPSRIVFEITERSSIEDFSAAQRILEHYRKQGYRIAIDDAGAGYSSLQAIAELHPDFIKVDRSLIQNIHLHKTKETIVETLVTFAQKLHIQMIAEGIEQWDELQLLTRLGVHYGQGYLLGHPSTAKSRISPEIKEHIVQHRRARDLVGGLWSIGDLAAPVGVFESKALISEVANYFKKHENAPGVVIVNQQAPVGLMMRERLFQQLAGQYGFSLFWNRSIDQIMDPHPLIVEESTPVESVSQLATARDNHNLYDLVIITKKGLLSGASTIRSILECITNARMEYARVASPLTGLPGNLQIHRELQKRLMDKKPFSVLYIDLDYFKWFNDRYGFQKGDQLLQYTADIIQQSLVICGNPYDFVGHIGGDDFIAITTSEDSEKLCLEMIRRFEQGIDLFYEGEDMSYVEDRMGNRVENKGVTVSLSLVICGPSASPVTLEDISQAAAGLKKRAKSSPGSIYCVCHMGQPQVEVETRFSAPDSPLVL